MQISKLYRQGRHIGRWTRKHCTIYTFAVLVGIIIGICSGFCAWLLKLMISLISKILTGGPEIFGIDLFLLILPVSGIILTVVFQQFILKQNIEHGTEKIESRLKEGKYNIRKRMIFAPMIASTLTLGFGGSAGSEGPIATSSASIGSAIGRLFGMDRNHLRLMIGIGAGAGIAGIFKAPIGGALFTIEVLMLEITTLSVITLIISCIASSMTAYVLSSCTYDINVINPVEFDTSIIPWVILFGGLCGLYSVYYTKIMTSLRKYFEGTKNIWLRAMISGGILSLLVFLFPVLYGEGYNSLSDLLNGSKTILTEQSMFNSIGNHPWLMICILCGIILSKPVAACSTNSGGGVAGDFAPTLFAGGIFGFLFALVANNLFDLNLTTAGFAYIGMAGVMAGAVRAPLMAMFLTAEMCDGYQFLLALLIAATLSFCIVKMSDNLNKSQSDNKPTSKQAT